MARILLADDSPHAQRMGERILEEEGYEVYTVNDGDAALVSLSEVKPDLIVADMFLPRRSGQDLCRFIKGSERFRAVPVVLTLGALENFDEEDIRRVGPDAILRKPFEASIVLETLRPLMAGAVSDAPDAGSVALSVADVQSGDGAGRVSAPAAVPQPDRDSDAPPVAILSREDAEDSELEQQVRAAVAISLERLWPHFVDEITAKVLLALKR